MDCFIKWTNCRGCEVRVFHDSNGLLANTRINIDINYHRLIYSNIPRPILPKRINFNPSMEKSSHSL